MKRHQLSGAQKRKLKKSKEEDRILNSGAILKFFQQQPYTSNTNIEYLTTSRVGCEEAKSVESICASDYKYREDKDREETLADFDEQYVIEDEPDIAILDEISNVPLYCDIGN